MLQLLLQLAANLYYFALHVTGAGAFPPPLSAARENELLEKINEMGLGPAGLGGKTTALGVNIETSPTHIAGMPVAVNICCHAARHADVEI